MVVQKEYDLVNVQCTNLQGKAYVVHVFGLFDHTEEKKRKEGGLEVGSQLITIRGYGRES